MDLYLAVKTIHILSATVLFGTGLGTAFHMWMADRGGEIPAIARAAKQTVLADWLFTTPTVIVQPLTGAFLLHSSGTDWSESWVAWSLALYIVSGMCWLPVVWIQLRIRDLAATAAATGGPLPTRYRRLMRAWFLLGWPAFGAMIGIFGLMVFRPSG